ncbi:MAG: DUF2029 domain-containing protein [Weeksellaceae bacterium]|nr:DUF2029 domain-containing protein [Weeksellaceae bacterium]
MKFISDYRIIFVIYIIVAAITAYTKYKRGTGGYNNYLIFKGVFYNTLQERNIFLQYPDLFFDSNHYGVFFSLLIAPFALLPDAFGAVLWNVASTLVFLFAIYKLPFSDAKKSFFGWLCLQEFITAATYFQFNMILTGLLMLSAIYIYQRKEARSAFAILIGTFVKVYGIVGLSGFFFIKNKTRFIISLLTIAILFFVLPMFISSPQFGVQSYADWYHSLTEKNLSNQSLTSRQDYSLMGVVRRVLGKADISNLLFLVPGFALFMLPYFRIKQYQFLPFQLMILASTLLFIVLFSSSSESPTYIIAVSGVAIWFLMQQKISKIDIGLLVFVMIFTCFAFSDLFPKAIKEDVFIKYSTKAIPCILIWFRVMYELLTKDFEQDYKLD